MAANDSIQRQVLPIPDRKPVTLTTYDAKDPDTKFPPITQLRPPTGAPNVLIVLLDDVGFGAASAFGGPCRTPNAEKLAANGLKYNRFHTTALCSPTRAAMLSGRNHHAVGMGGITEIATSAPGYNSLRPNTCAPLAEILKLNGYSTAQFGKCHEVPVFESTPIGPYDHWPTGSGFERFYGFIGGENNQYYPSLYDGTTPIEPERTGDEGYHLMEDLADKAIDYIRQQKSIAPDKPFFIYFAPGACHVPAPCAEGLDREVTRGRLRQGVGRPSRRRTSTDRRKARRHTKRLRADSTTPCAIPAWTKTEARIRPGCCSRDGDLLRRSLEHCDLPRSAESSTALGDLTILDDTLHLLHHRRQRRLGRRYA
jgi:arylsulfatase